MGDRSSQSLHTTQVRFFRRAIWHDPAGEGRGEPYSLRVDGRATTSHFAAREWQRCKKAGAMTYRGGASFAWQSDYTQFYLVDGDDPLFHAPEMITAEMMVRRWHQMTSGLVVYTNDSLHQIVDIRIYGAEPPPHAADWRSGKPWTQVELAKATFPSKRFSLTSPSKSGTEAYGPLFRTDSAVMAIRLSWMEFPAPRYDTGPVAPDVISVVMWPVS